MADSKPRPADLQAVPLFPLPNVVLFPRAVLPLHIFEDRYKSMITDVLAGERRIAMALLMPGWEKNYYLRPEIHPVVCVGNVLVHEKNSADGTYNFLLQGQTRARIVRERAGGPYRVADLEPLAETVVDEQDLTHHRRRLISVFDSGSLLATVIGRQFRQLLATGLSTSQIADLIAFNFLEDVSLKQSLLCECDIHKRVERTIAEFESLHPPLEPVAYPIRKPSMN